MKNKKIILWALVVLVSIVTVFTIYSISNKKEEEPVEETITETVSDDEATVNKNDKLLTKRDAVLRLKELFEETKTIIGKENAQTLAKKIDSNPSKWREVFPEEILEKYTRHVDIMNEEELKGATALVLLLMTDSIDKMHDGKIVVFENLIEESVMMDKESGTAFVPLDVFVGKKGILSVEMAFVNGEWVVSPFSLLQQALTIGMVGEVKE